MAVAEKGLNAAGMATMRGNIMGQAPPPVEVPLTVRQAATAVDSHIIRTPEMVIHRVPWGSIQQTISSGQL